MSLVNIEFQFGGFHAKLEDFSPVERQQQRLGEPHISGQGPRGAPVSLECMEVFTAL